MAQQRPEDEVDWDHDFAYVTEVRLVGLQESSVDTCLLNQAMMSVTMCLCVCGKAHFIKFQQNIS